MYFHRSHVSSVLQKRPACGPWLADHLWGSRALPATDSAGRRALRDLELLLANNDASSKRSVQYAIAAHSGVTRHQLLRQDTAQGQGSPNATERGVHIHVSETRKGNRRLSRAHGPGYRRWSISIIWVCSTKARCSRASWVKKREFRMMAESGRCKPPVCTARLSVNMEALTHVGTLSAMPLLLEEADV
ncbi:MAG: hypothetical protein CM15mP18_0660 [Methanobacteriota archaeon]|nr:MAG: hypothetical protein CM15mP18_0660 [Euryarchaeota archaeon]